MSADESCISSHPPTTYFLIMVKRKKPSSTSQGLMKKQRMAKKVDARKKREESKTGTSSASADVRITELRPAADLPPANARTAGLWSTADLSPGDQDNSCARSPSSSSDLSPYQVPSRRHPEIHIKDPSGGLKLAV